MVINYKQLREKREQVKESFRRNEDLTPLVRLAQGIVDAYEISLELPSQTCWEDRQMPETWDMTLPCWQALLPSPC